MMRVYLMSMSRYTRSDVSLKTHKLKSSREGHAMLSGPYLARSNFSSPRTLLMAWPGVL